jgi:predicted Zn finger-like uncharacterized protein
MINTKCPECTARFYVSEELVTGKVVRFRCRKCGGTITVDGTKSTEGSGEEATDGADAALLSRLPPALTDTDGSDKAQIKEPGKRPGTLRPAAGPPPPAKADQESFPRPPRPPSDVDAPAEGSQKPAVELKEKAGDLGDEADAPTDKVQKSKVKVEEPTDKVQKPKVEVDEPTDEASPIEAKPVPVPKTTEPAKSAVAGKSSDGDDDPTALWQKNKDKKKKEETPTAPPASKPRLSRVSMDLGSVFDMPADEEEVDVPLEMDDEPAFEEELEPESMSSDELEPGSLSPESLKSLGARPKPGAPPPPKIKPPPPKPKSTNLDRPSSARVDIRAALSRPAELSDLKAPEELFAPAAIPADTLSDLADVPDERDKKDEKVEAAPVLSPALSPALVSAEPSPASVRTKEEGEQGSNRGMIIGAAVVGVLILAGVGFFATRGDEAPATPPPVSTATAEPTEQPAPTSTAASPATGTAEPTDPAKPPDEPAEPAATETAAAPQPAGTTTSEPKAAAGATATATATAEPTATATATATAQPTATATATATQTATATAEPTTAPPPKPPDTGGEKPPFNKGAAASAIGALKGAAQGCKKADGPQGHARVSITFAPSGRVTVATVTGPPFAGTPVGGCIAATFRRASVPAFSGSNVTVHTSVAIF